MPTVDYYQVLGIGPTATSAEIRDAYCKQAKAHHPEGPGEEADKVKFQAAADAYQVLCDAEARRKLDDELGYASSDITYDDDVAHADITIKRNSACVTIKLPATHIHPWLDECTKYYGSQPKDLGTNGKNGSQIRTVYHTPSDAVSYGSISLTFHLTTRVLHVQGSSCLLWMVEHLPLLSQRVDQSYDARSTHWEKLTAASAKGSKPRKKPDASGHQDRLTQSSTQDRRLSQSSIPSDSESDEDSEVHWEPKSPDHSTKANTKNKSTSNKSNSKDKPVTRCCMCMSWLEIPQEEDHEGVWMCTSCRAMPQIICSIQAQLIELKDLQQSNQDVVKLTKECAELRAENARLTADLEKRQQQSALPTQPRTSNLLLGSSHVTRLERTSEDTQVRGQAGACLRDAITTLKKYPANDTRHVSLVIGSNDCDTDVPVDETISDFRELIHEAGRVAHDGVSVSSVLPRLKGDTYQQKADSVNVSLKELCEELHCNYVDNDANFRLRNDAVDDSIFVEDRVHLTTTGLNRLIGNLGLQDKVRVKPSYAKVASSPPSNQPRGSTEPPGSTKPPGQGQLQGRPQGQRNPGQHMGRSDDHRCWNCGETGHVTDSCRHGQRISCHRCNKSGHKQKYCRVRL